MTLFLPDRSKYVRIVTGGCPENLKIASLRLGMNWPSSHSGTTNQQQHSIYCSGDADAVGKAEVPTQKVV